MTQSISALDLVKQLRNRFGFRGSTDLQLDESIIPVANIGDLDVPPYHSKGGGQMLLQSGPVAAQNSYVGLRATSNLPKGFVAVVRQLTIAVGAANSVVIGVVPNAAADAVLAGPAINSPLGSWDSVEAETAQDVIRPALSSWQTTNAATFLQSTSSYGLVLPTPQSNIVTRDWVIRRGNTLIVQENAVNVSLIVAFYWDEYLLG